MTIKYEKTGEHRCPNMGEWFEGHFGSPIQAMFDFEEQEFDILRQVVTEEGE